MDEALLRRLQLCPDLPTLPTVAMKVVELGRDPEAGVPEVAEVVALDPALAAKLLRIANSPLYAQRRKVDNLRQALMLLGLNSALTLALSFSLVGAFGAPVGSGMDYRRYWQRCLLCGMASRVIGRRAGVRRYDDLFLAGLLQDIGMLVLDAVASEAYTRVIAWGMEHELLIASEHEEFNCDHAEVGAWMLEQWGMPDSLVRAVRLSHARTRDDISGAHDEVLGIACITLAGWLADIWLSDTDDPGLTFRIGELAQQLLGFDAATVHELIDEIGAQTPEMSALFEVELVDPQRVRAVLDHAREVLLVRNLQIIHEAAEARLQAEQMAVRARLLEERTRRDGLTGAFNRAYLEETLAREFRLAEDGGWPLSVAFIDLDYFKKVNDTWGHQAGDEVLREVVNRLMSQARYSDVVARYGGEEFVIVLPGIRRDSARMMLERLRADVANRPINLPGGEAINVTISVGLATHNEGAVYADAETLVRNADRAVYDAKRNGRNRVEVYADS